jgi:hypothetical protein
MKFMNPAQAFSQAALYTDGIDYRLVHLSPADLPAAASLLAKIGSPFCALIADKDEITLLLSQPVWDSVGGRFPDHRISAPYRLITFDLPLDFALIGFMALVSAILAQARVSILAISAFERDHIFVPAASFQTAWDALKSAQTL